MEEKPDSKIAGETSYLDTLLRDLVAKEGSDLHMKVGEPPIFRIHGSLKRTQHPVLTSEDTKKILFSLMKEEQRKRFLEDLELDISYFIHDLARFRVNVFCQKGNIGAVMRVIPLKIQSIDEWGLPKVLKKIALQHRGFVLVTGPTGSGKTTTLAAMIEHINSLERRHIITIEDPIEFLHNDNMATIEQRELGVDTHSFANALRHVMRQNPDVVLVGEMRDLETISMAITAAEMGSLVFATLHTTDAAQTVDRIIDVFPPEQQQQVRLQLSNSLEAVISQTLLPLVKKDEGRVAAFEILISTSGVRNVIREGKAYQLYSLIQAGQRYGMQLLDQSLRELYLRGVVSYGDALSKASNPQEFEQSVGRIK
ncbi:type IV pilus twitching motility protein PilT [candidate division TA06 bacterium]|nr:type IV pilus twitching motility protein PilT [candidate division TA06 bacterium]